MPKPNPDDTRGGTSQAPEKVIVMRLPVIMEDEGRHQIAGAFDFRENAEAWIKEQKGEYFGPRDYYIAE